MVMKYIFVIMISIRMVIVVALLMMKSSRTMAKVPLQESFSASAMIAFMTIVAKETFSLYMHVAFRMLILFSFVFLRNSRNWVLSQSLKYQPIPMIRSL